jgi:serine phosphatase RsbU (regulator of sigma subunit)
VLITAGRATPLEATFGTVLGVVAHADRPAAYLDLDTEDWSLLMYTDGLIEGRTGAGPHRLGVDGLCALLSTVEGRKLPPAQLPDWLLRQAVSANAGPLADDVAILLVTPGTDRGRGGDG